MRAHARLVNTAEIVQSKQDLQWRDLDKQTPSRWRLGMRWFFSFLPLVTPPAKFQIEMRVFIDREQTETAAFTIEKLPDLLSIFNNTPDFQVEKDHIVQSLSKQQINAMSEKTFQVLLLQHTDNKHNPFLSSILSRFSFDRFKPFFRSIEAKLNALIAKQQKADPVRVKPIIISKELVSNLLWCGHLQKNFSLDERKELIKLTYALLHEKAKPFVQHLLTINEIFQHLQSIDSPDLFSQLWKSEILITTEQRFHLVFENKDVFKALLKVFTFDEKYNLFRKLLAILNSDDRFNILNNFFQCITHSEQVILTNRFILDSLNNAHLHSLSWMFQGKVPALDMSLFSFYITQYYFGEFDHKISVERKMQDFDKLISEINLSDSSFPIDAKSFCLTVIIQSIQNAILADIALIHKINENGESFSKDTQAPHPFIKRFDLIIHNQWSNRENTLAMELSSVMTTLPDSDAFQQTFPTLKDNLEKLYQLYVIKDRYPICLESSSTEILKATEPENMAERGIRLTMT